MKTKPNTITREHIAAVVLLAMMTSVAAAQIDRFNSRWDDADRIAQSPLQELRKIDEAMRQETPRRRVAQFREGSLLIEVEATFARHEETGAWMAALSLDETMVQTPRERVFPVMPNTFLNELQHTIAAAANRQLTFEITAEAFVYDGRNYLLLRAPARAVSEVHVEDGAPQQTPPMDDQRGQQPARSAADVMRDLERETGPMHRPQSSVDGESSALAEYQWREGTLLIARRGRITRDAGGAWIFVFDADARGLADPPLILLPCLMLERVERFARQVGPTAPVLMSGQVFVSEGRGYLLPSAFQLAYERTPLN